MDRRDVVDALLEHAEANDAVDAVVVDVPEDVLVEADAEYLETEDEHGRRIASTLVAGAVEREDDEHLALDSPSRVGGEDDFSREVRQRLRADGVYGFRDGNLDGVELPKDEVDIYRVDDP